MSRKLSHVQLYSCPEKFTTEAGDVRGLVDSGGPEGAAAADAATRPLD